MEYTFSRHKNIKKSLLLVVMILFAFFCGCGSLRVTRKNYDKIQTGMTFEEVVDILGNNYEVSADAGYGGISSSAYIWGNENKCIVVLFVNNRVFSKSQQGL